MQRLFRSSSFADVSDLFVQFTKGKYEGKKITFISTASITEKVNFCVANGKKTLEKIGLIVDDLEVSTATQEEILNKLQNNDAIYISGGNSFFLLQELKRTGADKIVTKQIESGKLYVGESVGSIILSSDIEYVKDMDELQARPSLKCFSGLGLVDFYPLPHHTNFPFKEAVEKIILKYG